MCVKLLLRPIFPHLPCDDDLKVASSRHGWTQLARVYVLHATKVLYEDGKFEFLDTAPVEAM